MAPGSDLFGIDAFSTDSARCLPSTGEEEPVLSGTLSEKTHQQFGPNDGNFK
jgi:hypothetical protein